MRPSFMNEISWHTRINFPKVNTAEKVITILLFVSNHEAPLEKPTLYGVLRSEVMTSCGGSVPNLSVWVHSSSTRINIANVCLWTETDRQKRGSKNRSATAGAQSLPKLARYLFTSSKETKLVFITSTERGGRGV